MNDPHDNQATSKKSNTTLWVMIILFALPNLAAFYFYFNRDNIDFSRFTSNHGTIISPVRQVADITLTRIDDAPLQMSSLKGKWLMVSIGSSSCQQDCQDNLYKMRQIRKATGEFFKRVDRLLLLTDTTDIDSFRSLLSEGYSKLTVVIPPQGTDTKADGSAELYSRFLSGFSIEGEPVEDGIYFIDPLGNYMMAFPPQTEAKKILKDLMRLLDVSQIG
ncbi:MAG: hypothetical protein IMF14_01780 [Proteobacteria bacterium]|nr:hypothetical protein [Pseudomonadota bacterium]